jgi:hypothetical protein
VIVVAPYRPFHTGRAEHEGFDWLAAARLLARSVDRTCQCPTYVLTDVDTDLPVPTIQVVTRERQLQLWILDVALRYLESSQFTDDTVMVSPDSLVLANLAGYFEGDFGVIIRPGHPKHPMLNSVQWWPRASRDRLIAIYQQALAVGRTLPARIIKWGADTLPFEQLLAPLVPGLHRRQGLHVRMWPAPPILRSVSTFDLVRLTQGHPLKWRNAAIADFRYKRKPLMKPFFRHVVERGVS